MNPELITYKHKVKIGWLITALVGCITVFTLGVFVSPFVAMNTDLHVLVFVISFIIGIAGTGGCVTDIFKRIKDIEIWKNK